MPHTKRKGATRMGIPPASSSTPLQSTLERYLTAGSQLGIRRTGPALENPGEEDSLRAIETSLSPPPASKIPPHPVAFAAREGDSSSTGSVRSKNPERDLEQQQKLLEQVSPVLGENVGRTAEVNLETIWQVLKKMEASLQESRGEVITLTTKVGELQDSVEKIQVELSDKVKDLQQNSEQLIEFKATVVKDKLFVHNKLEQLENYNRRLNLRVLNFPRLPGILPMDMFKRYSFEILKLPQEAFPPLNKIFYLPQKKGKDLSDPGGLGEKSLDLANISEILEQTLDIKTERRTLLISFTFEQDLKAILRLYFRNSATLFAGAKVWMFQDVTKSTQQRRKSFLELKQKTLDMGGSFLLAYPCKCIVRLGSTKYVFFIADQLRVFLDSKKPDKI